MTLMQSSLITTSSIITPSPIDLGLPHPEWRPHQYESVQWAEGLDGVGVGEMPTGCHEKGQGILLSNGDIMPVEHIEIGDVLVGQDLRPQIVEELIYGRGLMYTVQPAISNSFVVNTDHLLTVRINGLYTEDVPVRYFPCGIWLQGYELFHVDPDGCECDFEMFMISLLGPGKYYGFSLSNRDREFAGRYLLPNRMVTHNSGKTGIAAALSHSKRVVALTRTKNLQLQYGDLYGAHLVMGKSNYPCLHPDAEPGSTPNECLYSDSSMHVCPHYNLSPCPYSVAKEQALRDKFISTNYSYWLTNQKLRKSHIGCLVLDECHLTPDVVLDWAGLMIHAEIQALWQMPKFPEIEVSKEQGKAADWLEQSIQDLRDLWKSYKAVARRLGDEDRTKKEDRELKLIRHKLKRVEMLGYRLKAVKKALTDVTEAWFIRAGPGKVRYRGRPVPGIIIRPLTARYHWPRLFGGFSESILLMSATVGNFEAFAQELGIAEWEERRVPNQFAPNRRPIYVLDCPRMSFRSKKLDYDKQADEIASAIRSCPKEWCGIVHVTKKVEAKFLADRLARRGLQNRVWVPPTEQGGKWLGTQDQALAWETRKAKVPNSIMVSWQFHQGFDGLIEKICIIAKVPFPNLSSEYEKQRMQYSHRFYNQRTAWKLVQALGRTRRGREEDYDLGNDMRGYVAVADSNWTRVKSYLSDDFLDALVI